jgi:ATP-dependent DNA helicase RecQ
MTTKSSETFASKFPGLAAQFNLKPFQEKVIERVIHHGSTLAVMPTGGGKSLIYWVAAQALGGTCLVVSPLIALIDEQAEKLTNEGFKVLAIHGGMGASEQMKVLKDFAIGSLNPDFIFVSPERMATDGFFEYCINLQKQKIKLLVIDEIHCVSQWGFDFRPFYKRIPVFLNDIFGSNWPAVLGLTATINPKELQDICADFAIPHSAIIKDTVLLRFDINLNVEKFISEDDKEERLWELIDEHPGEKILVYLYRKYHKRGVEDLCEKALDRNIKAVSFHGDLTGDNRQDILKEFKSGKSNVVFATNAFGMGIDIPDIRVVIHFMLPESIEQYYQEIGRAGRDGHGAESYMLFTNKNIQVRKTHFIDKSFPVGDEIKSLFKTATNNEIGKKTLQYFSEEDLQSALPYFLNCNAISIEGKGFTGIKVFKSNSNKQLQEIIESSRTGMVIPIMLKPQFAKLSCRDFFYITYKALISGEAKLSKNLDKCLIIHATEKELTVNQLASIEVESNSKREYKHNLLDYLVYLLNNFENSKSLHQEIGRYLGVDKHLLDKIHKTESGIWVRSKSEVIISNILYRSNIPFEYEKKLFYSSNKWKEPDFTIEYSGKTWYWEHLGLLGDEKYDAGWAEKKAIYVKMGIMSAIILTKESAVLSSIANEKIKLIKM